MQRLRLVLALATCSLLLPVAAAADEASGASLNPTKAYGKLVKKTRRMRGAERAEAMKADAQAFLEAWKASGRTATGDHLYSLAQFHEAAGDPSAAVAGYQQVQLDGSLADRTRDLAARNEANLLMDDGLRASMGATALDAATERLCSYAGTMKGDARKKHRATLRMVLADLHEKSGRDDAAYEMRMAVVKDDTTFLARVTRPLMHGLLGSTHALDGYEPLRKRAGEVLATLRAQQQTVIDEQARKLGDAVAKLKKSNPDALDASDELKESDARKMGPAERAVYSARRSRARAAMLMDVFDKHEATFAMLAKPAPAWTLEHAFGDVEKLADLRGKVVVLDFWATWCPWCIKSFPAIRDLLRDYEGKGLVVVGVTASAGVVYEQRYDLDDDLASKAEPGAPLRYAARLADERNPADESRNAFEEEAYRAKEIEAIQAFIANHEMNWPVVMIDKEEPAEHYALAGWPHAVVLDRQGRMRYFKSGALLRDRPGAVAKFRKVLDDLLADPATR
jgi:thiol-disulfide isomerase/thioredoxin